MEFFGRVKEIGNVESGTSPKGTWTKQTVVIESFDNPNYIIAIDAMNERTAEVQKVAIGSAVKATFSVNSRKGEKGYFTSVTLWELSKL